MRRRSSLVVALAPVVLAMALCACDTSRVRPVLGLPALSPVDALAFGTALAETRVHREVTIKNDGPAAFDVLSLSVLGVDTLTDDFPDAGFTVPAHDSRVVTFTWQPVRAGNIAGRAVFSFDHAYVASGGAKLELTVSGTAVSGCAIEPGAMLDFGVAAVNTASNRAVTIVNPTPVAWTITLGDLDDPARAFDFNGIGPGIYTVPAAHRLPDGTVIPGELPLSFDFRPTALGDFEAAVDLDAPSACGERALRLRGTALRDLVRCSPQSSNTSRDPGCEVRFNFVPLGGTAARQVFLQNVGTTQTVMLSQLHVSGSPDFKLDSSTPRELALYPGATYVISVQFSPSSLGEESAQLVYFEDDPDAPPRTVALSGFGGAPRVAVTPTAVDFGRFAVDNSLARTITVSNVGDALLGSSEANLRFATLDHAGWHTTEPVIEPGIDAADFAIDGPIPALDSGIAAGGSVALTVRFVPHSRGEKSATLALFTNDPSAPVVRIALRGLAEPLAPCEYDATTGALDFGEVAPGEHLDLVLLVHNRATDPSHVCLLRDAGIVGGGFDFAVPMGDPTVIEAGATAVVPLRFAPSAEASYAATAHFTLTNPLRPSLQVALQGLGSDGCLMLLPRDSVDFGVAKTGCNSPARSLFVYNACSARVHLDSIGLIPGSSSEFVLSLASSGDMEPLSSLGATLSYRPGDEGADYGAVAALVTSGTASQTLQHRLVRAVKGAGSRVAVQEDLFQTLRPRVDVLFVVDNSTTMEDKQDWLAANFGTFLGYLNDLDYRVAVTTTSTGCTTARVGCENGHFVPLVGGPRVITPSMAPLSPSDVFASNAHVGTGGRSDEKLLEPIVLALSPPLVRRENAGFLRDDATLAVVIVSDAADDDETSIDAYENFLVGLKGKRSMITVAGVVPIGSHPPPGCQYESDSSGIDSRVRDLAARFNGPVRDICSSDWSSVFGEIGKYVRGYNTEFQLTSPADAAMPIMVSLDDVPYSATGPRGETRWWYSLVPSAPPNAGSPRPTIVFDPLAQPDFGMTLTVRYSVACN